MTFFGLMCGVFSSGLISDRFVSKLGFSKENYVQSLNIFVKSNINRRYTYIMYYVLSSQKLDFFLCKFLFFICLIFYCITFRFPPSSIYFHNYLFPILELLNTFYSIDVMSLATVEPNTLSTQKWLW